MKFGFYKSCLSTTIRILSRCILFTPFHNQLIEVFPHDGDLYLVEPFYPSYIQQYLTASTDPFNEEQIKYIVFSAAKALLFLKSCHIIHGVVLAEMDHE